MSDDHEAIRNLAFEYTFRLDAGDFDGVAELLSGAVLRPAMPGVAGEGLRGAEAIRAFYSEQVVTYGDGDPRTRHLITNQAIELDREAGAASSRCYFTVLQRPPKLPYAIVVGGRYEDRFAYADGAWRFTEKVIHVDHLNDIEHHFAVAPERRRG